MEENTITFIDTAIIFKLIMHHVGKLSKLNLLIFSMSRVGFISYFRRSVWYGGSCCYNWLCYNGLYLFYYKLYYDGLFFKGYMVPVPHYSRRILYSFIVRIVSIIAVVVMAVMMKVIMSLMKVISAGLLALVLN